MSWKRWPLLCAWLVVTLCANPGCAWSAGGPPTVVYDLEIQDYLSELSRPIWKAAGLPEDRPHIYIINDQSANAFALTGQDILVSTGLIGYVKNSSELIGVLAHEAGHLALADVLSGARIQKQSIYMMLISMALGATAVTAGAGGMAGMAIMAAGMSAGASHTLAHSRAQEALADQAAVTFLDRAHISSKGILSIFRRFSDEEKLRARVDPFLLTHPLSSQRLDNLKRRVGRSPHYEKALPEAMDRRLEMIQAKLHGLLDNPGDVENQHKKDPDDSSENLKPSECYALAIARYRLGRTEEALEMLDRILEEDPSNPYVWEMKGQLTLDFGDCAQALLYFREASRQRGKPSSTLLLQEAQCFMQMAGRGNLERAIFLLQKAQDLDPYNPLIPYQASVCYGRVGQVGMAELSLAQRDIAMNDIQGGKVHAQRAQENLTPNSPAWLRAQDILMRRV